MNEVAKKTAPVKLTATQRLAMHDEYNRIGTEIRLIRDAGGYDSARAGELADLECELERLREALEEHVSPLEEFVHLCGAGTMHFPHTVITAGRAAREGATK